MKLLSSILALSVSGFENADGTGGNAPAAQVYTYMDFEADNTIGLDPHLGKYS